MACRHKWRNIDEPFVEGDGSRTVLQQCVKCTRTREKKLTSAGTVIFWVLFMAAVVTVFWMILTEYNPLK